MSLPRLEHSTSHPRTQFSDFHFAEHDAAPTVNDLISSLRKSAFPTNTPPPATITTPTLPPQIRHLLAQPESAPPRPRARTRPRFDASGRRIPPGPAPPRSWLEGSLHAPAGLRRRGQERVYPNDIGHLPGLEDAGDGRSTKLQEMCLRTMAREWEFVQVYEKNNLVDLPVGLRMRLLSNICVYGPDDGIGSEGLRNLLIPPPNHEDESDYEDFDAGRHNNEFFRLDVSGAMGHSVSFKQLTELLQKPSATTNDPKEMSWEENLSLGTLSAPIPHLTHLSLSHPALTISWRSLLAFSKHIPILTHLSLAFWPVPSLTPNAKTAVVQSRYGRDVQYGGTNYYSHSLDNDFREASEVLRRLAGRLYGLEYLDLSGCADWLRALRWRAGDGDDRGVDWECQWLKLRTLKIYSGIVLEEGSEYCDLVQFIQAYKEAVATEEMLGWWMREAKGKGRRMNWIEVQKDDWKVYEELWKGDGVEEKRKRSALDSLQRKGFAESVQWRGPIVYDADEEQADTAVERRSVWEQ
jgi:hypothetical protein